MKKITIVTLLIIISIGVITSLLINKHRESKRVIYLIDKESKLDIMKMDLQNLSDSMTLKPTKENWDLYEIQCIQIKNLENEITKLK